MAVRRIFSVGILLLFSTICSSAYAGVRIGIGIGFPAYYRPYRVYVAPPPIYVAPAPVYVQPVPAYVQPVPAYAPVAPAYVAPAPTVTQYAPALPPQPVPVRN
jgi:hypothetical protein